MKYIVLFAALLLTACMGIDMPASIKQENSNFDGSTAYRMQPGFAFKNGGGHNFQIGAHWHNKTPDVVMLRAMVRGEIINLNTENGLQFNIDGDIIKLNSPNITTDFETSRANGVIYKTSFKDYTASRQLLSRLVKAHSVKAKLVTINGYLEADLSIDSTGSAMVGFRDLNEKINTHTPSGKGNKG